MTCPYCGVRQQPKKQHVTWPNGKKEVRLVYDYECDECAATQEVDGSRPDHYREFYSKTGTEFDARPDGTPEPVGYHFEGLPCSVLAVCGQGHYWRLRGVSQITDLE